MKIQKGFLSQAVLVLVGSISLVFAVGVFYMWDTGQVDTQEIKQKTKNIFFKQEEKQVLPFGSYGNKPQMVKIQ